MKFFSSAVLAVLLAVSVVGCSGKQTLEEAVVRTTKIKVMIQNPTKEGIVKKNTFAGKIIPEQSIKVYPNLSERVTKTYAEVGDYVNAGDLLFEVRTLHTENKVKTAEAELEAVKANAKKMVGSTIDNTVKGVQQGRDTLENALRQLKKGLGALEESVSSARKSYNRLKDEKGEEDESTKAAKRQYESLKKQLDNMDNSYDDQVKQIKSQMDISEEMTNIAQKDITQSISSMADALVEMQEKVYNNAVKELDDARVYSPISGIVRAKNITENNMVANTMVAYEIFTDKSVTVEFGVSEKNISKMAIGDEIEIEFQGKNYIGNIVKIPLMADSETGLFSVEASIKNADDEIISGAVVQVKAPVEKEENVITVPISCVYFEGDNVYLYINNNGVAKKVKIEAGISNNKSIQVISGVAEDDEIITTWHPSLLDGAEVEIVQSSGLTVEENPSPEEGQDKANGAK